MYTLAARRAGTTAWILAFFSALALVLVTVTFRGTASRRELLQRRELELFEPVEIVRTAPEPEEATFKYRRGMMLADNGVYTFNNAGGSKDGSESIRTAATLMHGLGARVTGEVARVRGVGRRRRRRRESVSVRGDESQSKCEESVALRGGCRSGEIELTSRSERLS